MFNTVEIDRRVQVDPYAEGTLTVPYLVVGALLRKEALKMFAVARSRGASIAYREERGFFETLFTDVKITGPAYILQWIVKNLNNWERDSDD